VRELAASLVTIALALAIVGAVVFGARDTTLFVPPPEAAAEGFGRALAAGRYDLARRQLSSGAQRRQPTTAITERFEPVRHSIGTLNSVEAFGSPADDGRAWASCELQGEGGSVALMLALVREQGLWKVESWEQAAEIKR
jgi:hypothetical protein